jgi:hypothetical protein
VLPMDYRLFSAATSPGFHRRSDSCIATSAARAVSEPPVNCAASNV